jgi:hypothetical protein
MNSHYFRTLAALALLGAAAQTGGQEIEGVTFTIRPDTTVSCDTATLCRVTATNHTGRTLDAGKIHFEALAREHGRVAARERGRFGGPLQSGATVETVIAFTGVFYDFEVGPARGRDSSRGSGRHGKKGGAGRSKRKGKRR